MNACNFLPKNISLYAIHDDIRGGTVFEFTCTVNYYNAC